MPVGLYVFLEHSVKLCECLETSLFSSKLKSRNGLIKSTEEYILRDSFPANRLVRLLRVETQFTFILITAALPHLLIKRKINSEGFAMFLKDFTWLWLDKKCVGFS